MAPVFGITWTVYWIFLPVTLISSVIFRFNLLSCIYLLFVLALPYSPRLSPDKIASWAGFSLSLMIMSGLFLLGHVAFQIALVAIQPYGSLVGSSCSHKEEIARFIGFERLDHGDVGNILRLLLPDIGVFLMALLSYVLIRKSTTTMGALMSNGENTFAEKPKLSSVRLKNGFILCFSMLFMALAGIAYPNVISFVYLFIFIILAMMWALHCPMLVPAVAALRACLNVVTSLQLLLLYAYQLSFMQQWLLPNALYSRLLGLTAIIRTDCVAPYKLLLHSNVDWTEYVNPGCILLLHWTLAVGVRMFYQDLQILQQQRSRNASATRATPRRTKNNERKEGNSNYEETHSPVQPLVQEEEVGHTYDAINFPDQSGEAEQNNELNSAEETARKDGVLSKISSWLDGVKKYSFYVVALIIMMIWSVTYHSWLTFVLLLWSCILWMTKDRAKYTLYCSPVFVIYGICLVLLQYIYSLDLKEELPTTINQTSGVTLYLSEFGLQRYDYPCLHLGAQILYLCGFWIVLHQFNYYRTSARATGEYQVNIERSYTERAAAFVYQLLCKYWVFLVLGFHLAVASEGYPTGIKIIYMALFLLNMVTFSISWTFWRKTLALYWTVLVIYTMLVLALIYTYQFRSFPTYWMSFTNFSEEQLADLGLVQSQTAGQLLLRILVPALFLLAVILQLQYFNKRFLEYTGRPTQYTQSSNDADESPEPEATNQYEMVEVVREDAGEKNWLSSHFDKLAPIVVALWNGLTSFLGRLLEFHLWKFVFITVFTASVYQVSALYGAFVVVWVLFLPFRKTHLPLFVISSFAASVILLGTMFYQLQFIAPDVSLIYNCSISFYGNTLNESYHLTHWIGVDKMQKSDIFFFHAEGFIAIVLMIAFERMVNRRQDWRRLWRNEPAPPVTAFYPSVTYKEMDDGLVPCAKFFINYFFFKFGVQACFAMSVVAIWVHNDVFSVLYSALLIVALTLKTRASLYKYWRFYVGILIVLLVCQYMALLGMPPAWCQDNEYPWTIIGTNETIRNRLVLWSHLPDYVVLADPMPSIADFFQLLFVVCQLFVFQKEQLLNNYIGDNRYLTGKALDKITAFNNPKKNFMLKGSRSLLDQTKVFIFKYTIWITMAIIFFAGTSRISIFTLGYLICFFFLLSRQQALLLGKPSRLLKVFTGFLAYTVTVITLKSALQIASCVYIDILVERACVFVQFMSLVCARPDEYHINDQLTGSCEVPYDSSGLSWDFVCFLFLLIQLRIFASYYFLHVAEDMRIAVQLASRGAELFNEKLIAEVKERERMEEDNISAIKTSMDLIKDAYRTLRKSLALLTTHTDATRSGDYYMFDERAARKDLSKTPDDDNKIMDPFDLLHTADTIGIKEALTGREEDKKKLITGSRENLAVGNDEEEVEEPTEEEVEELTEEEVEEPTEEEETTVYSDDEVKLRKKPDVVDSGVEAAKDVTDAHNEETESSHCDEEDLEEEDNEEEKHESMSLWGKIKQGLWFTWELLMSGIDSLTLRLNELNKDHRNVVLQLSAEKDYLSEENFKRKVESPRSGSTVVAIEVDNAENASSGDASTAIVERESSTPPEYEELKPIDFDKDQNRALRLFYALWFILIARTDIVCYFLIILNLMLKASMLSLVLPLAVFLWATLSIPRPTKVFWMFCIVYLEVVIVIKFIFQFEFYYWNSQAQTNLHADDPSWWPRILGIEQMASWSVMDLLQLLAIFFHISILKVHGLWDKVEVVLRDSKSEDQPNGKVQILEDVPSTSQEAVKHEVDVVSEEEGEKKAVKKKTEESFLDKFKKVLTRPYNHFRAPLKQRFSSVTDVYLYMFLCDVINFLIIIFGYNAFGQFVSAQSDVVSNIQSNNVPTAFLIMLLIQFIMMFIDRAIYLKKSLFAKLIFQIILVIGIHVWMFFILPYINQRPFFSNHVAQTWYFFKALYFLLSAYQIRHGYPKRVTGNFLTKSYGTVNLFLFKGYRAIPFLAEISAIMDWMYTGTSLGIGEWMKVWSIHAEVFELKCWRTFEIAYPSPRGNAKKLWVKYLVGGLLLFLLLAIIWFPLLLMNIALTIGGIENNPIQMDVKVSLSSFEPIFQVVADEDDISLWSPQDFDDISSAYSRHEVAASFLQRFSYKQVVSVNIDGQSKTVWIISPPQRELLAKALNGSSDFQILFEWTLTNDPSASAVSTAFGSNRVSLKNNAVRKELYQLLMGHTNITNVTIPELVPQYVYSPGSSSSADPAASLYDGQELTYMDVDFSIQSLNDSVTSWWSVNKRMEPDSPTFNMVVFSDKVSPSSLSFLVNYGIIGLYVSIVLVVGRLVRSIFIGTTASIMFNELPYVDRILMLCHDLFLVREEGEYEMEEDLYAKLIFLYRSPRLLIDWTRKPKIKNE